MMGPATQDAGIVVTMTGTGYGEFYDALVRSYWELILAMLLQPWLGYAGNGCRGCYDHDRKCCDHGL